ANGRDRGFAPFFLIKMPRPKPPCHVFNLVRTKVFARFELVAQSAHDDGPVGGAILIRRKSPASWLVRDAVVANFKLLDQDRSSNRRDARAAHGFVVRTPDCLRRINLLLINTAQRAGHQAGQIDLPGSRPYPPAARRPYPPPSLT